MEDVWFGTIPHIGCSSQHSERASEYWVRIHFMPSKLALPILIWCTCSKACRTLFTSTSEWVGVNFCHFCHDILSFCHCVFLPDLQLLNLSDLQIVGFSACQLFSFSAFQLTAFQLDHQGACELMSDGMPSWRSSQSTRTLTSSSPTPWSLLPTSWTGSRT